MSDALGLPGYADAVPVASGGTSTVWRARETAFDRLVAVKVIAFPLLDDDVRRRFSRELAMVGRLSGHPGVLTVHASGFTQDGRPYLTSEWCPAGSLADVVAQSGPLSEAQVAAVGVAVAEALDAAHAIGIVHRDVKPQNVFVTAYGRPALADFGIAVATAEVTSPTDSLTPTHAAPEVLQGGTAGPAADVWGLGSTLWTLLTGTPPYAAGPGEGVLPAMLRILSAPLPDVPATPVSEVLRQLLAKDAAQRPEALQVADRLRALAVGAAPLPQSSAPGSASGEATRRRAAAAPPAPAAHAEGAAAVFPVLPPSAASTEVTVSRTARPPGPAEPSSTPGRRRVLAGVAAAAVVGALVAGGWLLSQRGSPTLAAADGEVPTSAGASAAPSGTPATAGAAPTPTAPVLPPPAATGDPAPADPAEPAPAPAAPGRVAAPAPAPERQQPAPASPRPAAEPSPRESSPAPAPQPQRIPVYRCDRGAEDLLYSTNPSCKAGYTQVRQAWSVTKETGVPGTTPLWRLHNPSTGVHLLTWSPEERSRLLGGGWEADGQVGWVRTTSAAGWTRVWRLHDGRRYAYTTDASLQVWQDRGFRVEGQFWS